MSSTLARLGHVQQCQSSVELVKCKTSQILDVPFIKNGVEVGMSKDRDEVLHPRSVALRYVSG